jgi:NDP-sugar pyrophosphorylase family protein
MIDRFGEDLLRRARSSVSRGNGLRAVILAGGKGSRLMPYTAVLPKPLMPLGDRAILEFTIRQLQRQGIVDITLSVGHLAHLVEAVFGDGSEHGVEVRYVREDAPLGTAGPLRLVEGLEDTFLLLNGDLVTTFDFNQLVRAHREAGSVLTIATHRRELKIDYGVIELEDGGPHSRITGYREKPSVDLVVSTGIYAIEPRAIEHVPEGAAYDLPTLVLALIDAGEPVGSYTHDGLWLDVGRHDDYAEAVELLESGRLAQLDAEFAPSRRQTV